MKLNDKIVFWILWCLISIQFGLLFKMHNQNYQLNTIEVQLDSIQVQLDSIQNEIILTNQILYD